MKPSYEELEQKLVESQREFRAADATIENLQMKLNAEREAKLALAAENAGLKAALRPSDIPSELTDAFGDTAVIEHDSTGDNQGHSVSWSWVGNQEEVIKSVLLAVDKGIKTPATDAFLAEVRASAVEEFVRMADYSESVADGEVIVTSSSVFAAGHEYADQIRKGVQS